MKKILASLILAIALAFSISTWAEAKVGVRGYYKPSTGTYVQPHSRTAPNSSRFDNWSTKGNYNPYTGKKGTVDPFRSYRFR